MQLFCYSISLVAAVIVYCLDSTTMSARRSDDEGGRSQAWTPKPMNNGQFPQRSVPERSRTLSSSELNAKSSGIQYTSTTPVGSSQQGVSGTSSISFKTAYAMSRSEDGHSISNRGLGNEPIPPTPSALTQTYCASCGNLVAGQFIRALGVVYHRACFICSVSHNRRHQYVCSFILGL